MFNLKGKTALVTGASRGIGRAIVLALEEMGAKVIGTATTPEGAAAIGGKVLDVSDPMSIEKLISEILPGQGKRAEQGQETERGIDILVNNAGITQDNLLLRMKDAEWTEVMNTNLNSVYRMTKACLKQMLKNRWGRIINMSSVAAVMGNPGQTNYAAAKAGMIGFSKSLVFELSNRGITVNVVAPGFIDTDMTRRLTQTQKSLINDKIPLARLGSPSEVAAAAAFLASSEAAYITGETLHVNGGMYMQ